FDLFSELSQCKRVDAREQPPFAPLGLAASRIREPSAQHHAARLEPQHSFFHFQRGKSNRVAQLRRGDWARVGHPSRHQGQQRVFSLGHGSFDFGNRRLKSCAREDLHKSFGPLRRYPVSLTVYDSTAGAPIRDELTEEFAPGGSRFLQGCPEVRDLRWGHDWAHSVHRDIGTLPRTYGL